MVVLLVTSLVGAVASPGAAHGPATDGTTDDAVTYVRNAEEVKGHLESSIRLKHQGKTSHVSLHSGHAADYLSVLIPPVRNANADLATRLHARLRNVDERATSLSASEYETHVREDVFPLIDRAVETVVEEKKRESIAFNAKVNNALLNRIDDEYAAAVRPNETIALQGEYWDGRGFLVRIEHRYEDAVRPALNERQRSAWDSGLDRLRGGMEAVAAPSNVTATTLDLRVAGAAAVPLESAEIHSIEEAVTYTRNVEELRGHLESSIQLKHLGDEEAVQLHAGHGAGDYSDVVLPPVQRQNPQLAQRLQRRLGAIPDHADESPGAYESYIRDEVFPVLDRAREAAVPREYRSSDSFDRRVIVALGERIEGEYDAAVDDEGHVQRHGEYWDARGFLVRIEQRFAASKGNLDADTRQRVSDELGILREELEHTATPEDVSGSIHALEDALVHEKS
jgi:hypothetical protein